MGASWENRLHVRGINLVAVGAGLAFGAALPTGILSHGDAGRLLVTFLGLVAAGILPTVSLILTSMTASGRSVHRLSQLKHELESCVSALFVLFGLICLSVGQLLLLSLPVTEMVQQWLPLFTLPKFVDRIGQAIVFGLLGFVLLRAFLIPAIVQRSLAIRAEIAIEEAQRRTKENAPGHGEIAATFKTKSGFGDQIKLAEIKKPRK